MIAEARQGTLRDVSFELITAACELALAGPVTVALIGSDSTLASQLNAAGVSEVVTIASPVSEFEPHVSAAAVGALIDELSPSVVLAGHTIDSIGFGAAVAAVKNTGFAADVISVAWDDGLTVQRGVYGDKFIQSLEFPGRATVVVLVRPGAYAGAPAGGGSASIRAGVAVDTSVVKSEHLGFESPEAGDVDITKSDFLLAIGRGTGVEDQSDVEPFYELAEKIGATLVASRPLVDAGAVPAARQVGQSGKTVHPKVYLALGVSGAVQHLMGMRKADTIIAVNTDRGAPIFGIAQYGAHTDLEDVVRALADAF